MTTARKVEMGPEEEGARPGVIEGGGEIGGGTAIAPKGGTGRVVERAMAEGGKGAAGEGGRKARNNREGEGEGEGRDLPVTRVASSCRPPLLTVADGERSGRRRRRSGFQISMGSGDSGEGRGRSLLLPTDRGGGAKARAKLSGQRRGEFGETQPDLLNESGFQARPDSDGVVSWGLRSEFFLKKNKKMGRGLLQRI